MIITIPFVDIEDRNWHSTFFLKDRHLVMFDRKDIYKMCCRVDNDDPAKVNLYYKIVQVNCNPDFDW